MLKSVKRAAASLLLLSACVTPDELQDSNREVVSDMAPILEQAASAKALEYVELKFGPKVEAVEAAVEDGDDAVRREFAEYLQHAKNERADIRSSNDRQHVMMRDAIDRVAAKSTDTDAELKEEVSKLQGRMEGTDEAIQQKSGVALGILTQTNLQLAQLGNQIRDTRSTQADYARKRKEWEEKSLAALDDKARRREKERWSATLEDVWDWASKVVWVIGAVAVALASIIGVLVLWLRKKEKMAS